MFKTFNSIKLHCCLRSNIGHQGPLRAPRTQVRNLLNFSETQNICCSHSKTPAKTFYHSVMLENDSDRMANSALMSKKLLKNLGELMSKFVFSTSLS